jgi:hypothetical protein
MQFISLEEHPRLFIVEHFCIPLERSIAKSQKFTFIAEQNSSVGLLVISLVTRVEYFNARLSAWLNQPRSYAIARGASAEIYSDNVRVLRVFLKECHLNLN